MNCQIIDKNSGNIIDNNEMTEYSENMNTAQTTEKQCLNIHKKVVRLKGHIYINTILPLINGQLFSDLVFLTLISF